ncbi:MAG: AtpZ/AtpI family protein [Bacteroidales bacterium]|jgi:F0F1-type ATP synthase assembly protein I|nr:AtpZ/AtpI family protein [Bacteroidales bacterium]
MSDDKNKKSPLRSYAEYSGLGLELVAIVLVCVFIGVKLDEWVPLKFPLFTLFFVAVGLAGSIVVLIKRTKK